MVLRPRAVQFSFFGDTWVLALRSPGYMAKLRLRWDDVDKAVGPDRVLAGLTVPDNNLVYLDQTLSPASMTNVLLHELYHVASCKKYKKRPGGEEVRATCFGECAEYLLRKLSLTSHEEDPT